MIAQRWDQQAHAYFPYEVPAEWHSPLYCEDMDAIVNCAACGRELPYGDCYTSLLIHNHVGMGYPVCENCHRAEILLRMCKSEGD